jgi:hypothetical protein
LMNEPSVHGGAFKCKEKNLGVLLWAWGGHPRFASSCIGTDVVLHGSSNANDQREVNPWCEHESKHQHLQISKIIKLKRIPLWQMACLKPFDEGKLKWHERNFTVFQ